MPTMKKFKVTLYPAELDGAFISTRFCFGQELPRRDIEAPTVDAMLAEVRAFADEHGAGCHASVRCLEKRKPNGFDAATERLYFNLEEGAAK